MGGRSNALPEFPAFYLQKKVARGNAAKISEYAEVANFPLKMNTFLRRILLCSIHCGNHSRSMHDRCRGNLDNPSSGSSGVCPQAGVCLSALSLTIVCVIWTK